MRELKHGRHAVNVLGPQQFADTCDARFDLWRLHQGGMVSSRRERRQHACDEDDEKRGNPEFSGPGRRGSQHHFGERQQNHQGKETQEWNDPLGRANGGKNKDAEDMADAARNA